MVRITKAEWYAEGERRFGKDPMKWKIRCPMCGHVAKVEDFREAGANGPDCAFVECIGRYTGKGSPKEGDSSGCNWAAYGLFGIPKNDKYVVVFEDGTEMECFPFADKEDKTCRSQ